MIGIIIALKEESEELISTMKNVVTKEIAGRTFYKGTLFGKEVVLVMCGVGKVNAALCTQALIDNYSVDKILHTGVAGGLSPQLEPGDLVIATSCVQHDFDTTKFGDKLGQIANMDVFDFPCAPDLVVKALSSIGSACSIQDNKHMCREWKAISGRIASGDQFIAEKEKSIFIRDTFNAVACEMEGAAVAHVCYLNKVPLLVIRAISDNASTGAAEDYTTFLEKAVSRTIIVLRSLFEKL